MCPFSQSSSPVLSTLNLEDRIVVVVGAGGHAEGYGNGQAAAITYANLGALVVCCDRDESALEITVNQIHEMGGSAVAAVFDALDEKAVTETIERQGRTYGRIDVLHNNVGGSGSGRSLDDIDLDDWRVVFDRNVTSAMLACRAVAPLMRSRKSGAIINISSIASIRHMGVPSAVYSAAKAAVNEFTRNIAVELAPDNVRANSILPGYIDTPFLRRIVNGKPAFMRKGFATEEEFVEARNSTVPMKRMGTAWDVANAAAFLASDLASYVTGETLVVDGGVTSKAIGV